MATRLPLFIQDNESIQEWNTTIMDNVHRRIAYSYANDPSVQLSVVSSGGNISPEMNDTRYISGAASRNTTGPWPAVTTFPAETTTEEPQLVTTTYDKVSQTRIDPAGHPSYYNWTAKPVYYDYKYADGITTGKGGWVVREMSFQDIIDTFITPTVDNIVNLSTSSLAGGAYFISTATSLSNCTNLGTIFSDTKATVSSYAANLIGTAGTYQTHSETVLDYQLFKNNGVQTSYRLPLVVDYSHNGVNSPSGLREMTQAEFQQLFTPLIRQQIYNGIGNTLEYNFDGDGVTKGTAITNTALTEVTGNYTTYIASANDYRAQEFPNGTLQTIQTWRLKLNRT